MVEYHRHAYITKNGELKSHPIRIQHYNAKAKAAHDAELNRLAPIENMQNHPKESYKLHPMFTRKEDSEFEAEIKKLPTFAEVLGVKPMRKNIKSVPEFDKLKIDVKKETKKVFDNVKNMFDIEPKTDIEVEGINISTRNKIDVTVKKENGNKKIEIKFL